MSKVKELIFPDLIYLDDYGGIFSDYFKVAYSIFENDFIRNPPTFDKLAVSAPRLPLVDDKHHRTFYHITHEGDDEQNREPDLRRMERIRFPKFVIVNNPHVELMVWEKTIGRDRRIHILNEEEQYLVVLTRRKSYLMLCTAFYINQKHTIKKKLKEYEMYKKTKTA
ncbi:MAG: hypothetical protein IT264_04645 [Saprospiraceae bacterium]|nr:hypothetical protein [Saprospiraceae bacterium]